MAERKIPKQGIRVTDIWISIICPNDFCKEKFRVHMKAARSARNCPYCIKSTAVVNVDWESRRGWLITTAVTLDVNNHTEPYVVEDGDIDFDIPTDDVVG